MCFSENSQALFRIAAKLQQLEVSILVGVPAPLGIWTEDSIMRRTKRGNLILVLNRPIIPKNNQ